MRCEAEQLASFQEKDDDDDEAIETILHYITWISDFTAATKNSLLH